MVEWKQWLCFWHLLEEEEKEASEGFLKE